MSKKYSKTFLIIICALLGWVGFHRFLVGKYKSGLLYFFTCGLCGIGWIVDIVLICLDKFYEPVSDDAISPSSFAINDSSSPQFSNVPKRPISSDYYYQNVDVCIIKGQEPNFDNLRINDFVTMEIEHYNPYDSKAILLSVGFDKIGYLYRSKLKDMVYDFLARNDSVEAYISDISDNSIKINIALFKLHRYDGCEEDEYADEDDEYEIIDCENDNM